MSSQPTGSSPTALLTCSGKKSFFLRLLASSSRAGRIIPVDADPACAVRDHSPDFVLVPPVEPPEAYIEALLDLCRVASARLVIPTNDLDLLVLARATHRFEAQGVRVLGAPMAVVEALGDKLEAGAWLSHRGFHVPHTVALAEAPTLIGRGGFPLVAKARRGQGSAGLAFIERAEDLARLPGDAVLQPHLAGPEYNLDILRDPQAGVVAVVPKRKLAMYGGTTQLARTVEDQELLDLGVELGNAIGHVGGIDVDLIRQDGAWQVIDVNPRIGGGLPTAAAACPAYLDGLLSIGAGQPVRRFLGEYLRGVEVRRDVYYYQLPSNPGEVAVPWSQS
jgi:carbamoyl-phosphate synthase large subunit